MSAGCFGEAADIGESRKARGYNFGRGGRAQQSASGRGCIHFPTRRRIFRWHRRREGRFGERLFEEPVGTRESTDKSRGRNFGRVCRSITDCKLPRLHSLSDAEKDSTAALAAGGCGGHEGKTDERRETQLPAAGSERNRLQVAVDAFTFRRGEGFGSDTDDGRVPQDLRGIGGHEGKTNERREMQVRRPLPKRNSLQAAADNFAFRCGE